MISKTRGTHYSLAQAPADMWEKAAAIGAKLIADAKEKKAIPVLAYTGMSGTATASAVSLWLTLKKPKFKFYMVYVRKPREKSHGRCVEHNMVMGSDSVMSKISKMKVFIAFMDDLIASGDTLNRVLEKIARESKRKSHYGMVFQKLDGVEWESYCTSDY